MAYNNSTPPPTPSTPKVLILGCDISVYSKRVQFIICVGGVFIFYVLYGYYQELIFRTDGFKPFGWYLTFIQFIYYTIFSSLESVFILKDTKRRIPLQTYALLAFLTVGTMGMSNASLGYLNYPTQVIFKCCKLIPVMFGGILIQGKKYGVLDFFSCLCMSIGLTCFILADSSLQPSYNYIGIVMMTLALSADAAIGNVQEKAMKTFSATNTEVVLYSYGIGVIYLFLTLLFNGMLLDGFSFFAKHPFATYGYAFIFSLTGYVGISFVLSLIRVFGALLAVTVTTCRKAVSIILSFMMFTKPFTIQYVWSGLIVLLGILLNVYQKNKSVIDVEVLKHLQAASISFGWKRRRRLLETV